MSTNTRSLLAAQNAVVRLILSGYQADDAGWAAALGDVGAAITCHGIKWQDLAASVKWALAALPRSCEDPMAITDWLAATYAATSDIDFGEVPDADH